MSTNLELLQQITEKNSEILKLKNEIEKLEKYKAYENAANELKAVHDCFVNEGFTQKQSFELLKVVMKGATKDC